MLKRKPNNAFINNLNKSLTSLWNASIDIQYIVNAYKIASYCAPYITKFDSTLIKAPKTELNDFIAYNMDTLDKLKHTRNTVMNL